MTAGSARPADVRKPSSLETGARVRVGIVGVSGYSGIELVRILSRHPHFRVVQATSDKWAGAKLGDRLALPAPAADVVCLSQAEGKKAFAESSLVFLCTPAEVSCELAPLALAAGARVVDISGAFRLPAADYPRWYGFSHPDPGLLAQAVYSLPEATGTAERLPGARLVSNPGCYATAAALAVLPLLRAGLVDPGSIIIDAKSGTTGAGRRATEEYSFSEVDGDIRAYRILRHQHTPEIERILALGGAPGVRLVFTPHLLPVKRGILATAYGRLTAAAAGDPGAAVAGALAAFVEGKPFLRLADAEAVTLASTAGTNRVVLGGCADGERNVAIVCASLDNLVKGAAGQAVQNANLMFGLPESAGLADLLGHAP
jgi:N-acetyl-gamma-glutamyl-phosphate reductase